MSPAFTRVICEYSPCAGQADSGFRYSRFAVMVIAISLKSKDIHARSAARLQRAFAQNLQQSTRRALDMLAAQFGEPIGVTRLEGLENLAMLDFRRVERMRHRHFDIHVGLDRIAQIAGN